MLSKKICSNNHSPRLWFQYISSSLFSKLAYLSKDGISSLEIKGNIGSRLAWYATCKYAKFGNGGIGVPLSFSSSTKITGKNFKSLSDGVWDSKKETEKSPDLMKLSASLFQRMGIDSEKIKISRPLFSEENQVQVDPEIVTHNLGLTKPEGAEVKYDDAKSSAASAMRVVIPFALEHSLRGLFQRPDDPSAMRWGLLLELLDALAGDVAYLHATPKGVTMDQTPFTIVTLSIDGLVVQLEKSTSLESSVNSLPEHKDDLLQNSDGISSIENKIRRVIFLDKDVTLLGYVTFVGNSSMEIRTEIIQEDETIGAAYFVMVALDRLIGNPRKVPSLSIPPVKSMQQLYEEAKQRNNFRKSLSKNLSEVILPSQEESQILHNLWLSSLNVPKNNGGFRKGFDNSNLASPKYTWMSDTIVTSTRLMQRDKRNVHNKIFGGYLARVAFELAFITAQSFCRSLHPQLLAIDQIFFLKPVELGSVMDMVGQVVFSNDEEFHVQVKAFQVNPLSGSKERSNEFYFSFGQEQPFGNRLEKILLPQDYEQYMLYLAGRRRYLNRKKNKSTEF